jgi:uncharacterized protein with HEPN domain
MSVRDDRTRLYHMRDACEKIIQFTNGKTRDQLSDDELYQFAIIRLIEIIGEAASRLSDHLRSQYADVPWSAVIGMRNRLIHAYFDVDLDRIWDTITIAVPDLLNRIQDILEHIPPDESH